MAVKLKHEIVDIPLPINRIRKSDPATDTEAYKDVYPLDANNLTMKYQPTKGFRQGKGSRFHKVSRVPFSPNANCNLKTDCFHCLSKTTGIHYSYHIAIRFYGIFIKVLPLASIVRPCFC